MTSKTFCAFPFERRIVAPSGIIRPCCHYNHHFGTTSSAQDVSEINDVKFALLNNERHVHCKKCWDMEDLGLPTERSRSQTNYTDHVKKIEINLSNICNLKCRMCGSDSSSSWINDEIALLANPQIQQFRKRECQKIERSFLNDDALFNFFEQFDFNFVKRVTFLGGEPFLQKQLTIALAYLLKKNKHLTIQITSNATILQEDVINQLSQFDHFDFRLSIESVSPLYQYIRGGDFTLKNIESNLAVIKSLPNVEISMSSVISAYSIFDLGKLFAWSIKEIPFFSPEKAEANWYSLFHPQYLSPLAIPLDVRQFALQENLKSLMDNQLETRPLEAIFSRLLLLDHQFSVSDFNHFLLFSQELDKIRNESLLEVEPKFNSVYTKIC